MLKTAKPLFMDRGTIDWIYKDRWSTFYDIGSNYLVVIDQDGKADLWRRIGAPGEYSYWEHVRTEENLRVLLEGGR